jgi:hypothetical protein
LIRYQQQQQKQYQQQQQHMWVTEHPHQTIFQKSWQGSCRLYHTLQIWACAEGSDTHMHSTCSGRHCMHQATPHTYSSQTSNTKHVKGIICC